MKEAISNEEQDTKALLIARVSDPSQIPALPAQKRRLYEYAKSKGWTEHKDFEYLEFNETAYKGDIRHKFEQEVIEPVRHAKCKMILVFDKADRLSRDTNDEHKSYLSRLTKAGKLELHIPHDNLYINKDSPAGTLFNLDVHISLAAYYSASIRDNVKRKIELKLSQGEWPGKAPVGYLNHRFDENHTTVVIDEKRAPFVKEAFALRRKGWSYKAISRKLRKDGMTTNGYKDHLISTSNIELMLNNPFYYGVMRYDGKYHPHCYEPLITKKVFDDCKAVSASRAKNPTKYGSLAFAFKDVLQCSNCGRTLSSYNQKKWVYVQCSTSRKDCSTPNMPESMLVEQLVPVLKSFVLTETQIAKIMDRVKASFDNEQLYYRSSVEALEKEQNKLRRRIDVLYEDRLDGRIATDIYDKQVMSSRQRLEEVGEKLQNLKSEDKSFIVTLPYLLGLASNALETFKSSKPAHKNLILKRIVTNLKSDGKKLDVTLQKPFQMIADNVKNESWLRGLDSNQQPSR
ncbi:MAG: recombinase family protein [Candidatus Saccharimonadales bacterium]